MSLVLHVQRCVRNAVELLNCRLTGVNCINFDWWIVKEPSTMGDQISGDSGLGAHCGLIFEEIKSRPCVWNVGARADSSVVPLKLWRFLTAGIAEGGFCCELYSGKIA